mmetsp:Transcript_18206/g.44788  ORF Transcript_18206/g.44788 Transcript_18206/m.44788 type:complete len:167 (-) Transcript_18206:131-631(-)
MGDEYLQLKTAHGTLKIKLRPDAAPKTVAQIKQLVADGKYKGCCFYRAEQGFVLQGGTTKMDGSKVQGVPKLPLEYKLPNKRGAVTMARWEDPNTATGEFFVCLGDAPHLDRSGNGVGYAAGFTVFGEVVEGMDVAEAMALLPTTKNAQGLKMLNERVEFEASVTK